MGVKENWRHDEKGGAKGVQVLAVYRSLVCRALGKVHRVETWFVFVNMPIG